MQYMYCPPGGAIHSPVTLSSDPTRLSFNEEGGRTLGMLTIANLFLLPFLCYIIVFFVKTYFSIRTYCIKYDTKLKILYGKSYILKKLFGCSEGPIKLN